MTERPSRKRFAEIGARSNTPYAERLARYLLVYAVRNGLPPYERRLSLQEVADELVRLGHEPVSRERIRQLLKDGPPTDRRRVAALDRKRRDLVERIERWQSRGTKRGNARAHAYRKQLDELHIRSQRRQTPPASGDQAERART